MRCICNGILFFLLLSFLRCGHLQLLHSPRATADDWNMYGGTITRTNVSKTTIAPPLAPVWEYDVSAGVSPFSLAVVESLLFVGNLQGEVRVVNVMSGKEIGVRDFGAAIIGTPVVHNGLLYVALTREEENMVCYNLAGGVIKWQKKIGDVETAPLLIGEQLFVTTLEGKLICLNAQNGEDVWTYTIPPTTRTRMIHSSPASDSSTVVFGCDDGKLYGVGMNDGKLLWTASTGASIVASPSIRNGKVFIGSLDRNFYAFDASTGKELWKQSLGAMIFASQAVSDSYVYVGTSGGVLYCLGAASGSIVWKAPANGGITAAPLLSGNIVYVGCMDKTLYAYDAATGTVPWKFAVDGRITSSPVASKQSLFLLVEDRTVMALKHGDTK